MKGHVALVREQGVNFAVVAVKRSLLQGTTSQKDQVVRAFSIEFGVPAVLMAQDSRGVPTYYGRPDLVRWLANILPEQLPWREFRPCRIAWLSESSMRWRARQLAGEGAPRGSAPEQMPGGVARCSIVRGRDSVRPMTWGRVAAIVSVIVGVLAGISYLISISKDWGRIERFAEWIYPFHSSSLWYSPSCS
jgi:hypothetical protein